MTFSTERRVEFRDTDAAGIAHFSVFFPMMESAEHEMMRSLGIPVFPQGNGPNDVTWPRISASCNYVSAARFEDQLRIDVNVGDIGTTSVQFRFRFSVDGRMIAEGSMTAVCCHLHGPSDDTGQGPKSGGLVKTPIPDAFRDLLSKHQ